MFPKQKNMKKLKKLPLMDIILWIVALYLIFTVDFTAIDKFQQLLFMMYALCLVLRFGNVMKQKRKEFALREQETAEQQAESTVQKTVTEPPAREPSVTEEKQ